MNAAYVFWADVYNRDSWNAKKSHQTKAHIPVSTIAPVAYKLCNITEKGIENVITITDLGPCLS